MGLVDLPEDVIILVLRHLSVHDLVAVSSVNQALHRLVEMHGWVDHARLHPPPTFSMARSFRAWPAKAAVRYAHGTERAWAARALTARPLAPAWPARVQAFAAASPAALLVAAGERLQVFAFGCARAPGKAAPVRLAATYDLAPRAPAPPPRRDVTSVAFAPDGGLLLGFQSGPLERVGLPASAPAPGDPAAPRPLPSGARTALPALGTGEFVRAISVRGDAALALSAPGRATLFASGADPISSTSDDGGGAPALATLELGRTSWAAALRDGYAVFGGSGAGARGVPALSVHAFTDGALHARPSAVLGAGGKDGGGARPAVYALAAPPPSASGPWGHAAHVVLSGWFDGLVRVHDLRASARASSAGAGAGPAPLAPALTLADPWSDEAVYALACNGAHVGAGTARHALVAFWDVRAAGGRRAGWSAYGPSEPGGPGGASSSPVYSLVLEHGRAFGTTQSAPFVLDFGPGVGADTYDALPAVRAPAAAAARDRGGARGRWAGRLARPTADGAQAWDMCAGVPVTQYVHTSGRDH